MGRPKGSKNFGSGLSLCEHFPTALEHPLSTSPALLLQHHARASVATGSAENGNRLPVAAAGWSSTSSAQAAYGCAIPEASHSFGASLLDSPPYAAGGAARSENAETGAFSGPDGSTESTAPLPVAAYMTGAVAATAHAAKRPASRDPSPAAGGDESSGDESNVGHDGEGWLSAVDSFEKILNGLAAGDVSLQALAEDVGKAWRQKVQDFDAASKRPVLQLALQEAEAMGTAGEQVAGEIKRIIACEYPSRTAPSMEAYMRIWSSTHDGVEDVARTRERLTALVLSALSALTTLLRVMPRATHDNWCVLSTSHLVVDDKEGSQVPRIVEHAINMYALMPHDLCLSEIEMSDWKSRRPRTGGESSMEHTLISSTHGKEGEFFWTWQAAATLQLESLLRLTLQSSMWWLEGDEHRATARQRTWRVACLLSFVMSLYYMDPAIARKMVKSDMGAGLHSHNVRATFPHSLLSVSSLSFTYLASSHAHAAVVPPRTRLRACSS